MKLQTRLLVYYGLGAVVILALIASFIFGRMEKVIENHLLAEFYQDAESKYNHLITTLDNNTREFNFITSIPIFRSMHFYKLTYNEAGLRSDLRYLELYLLGLAQQRNEINTIRYINTEGREIIHIKNGNIQRNLSDFSTNQNVNKLISADANQYLVSLDHTDTSQYIAWWIPVIVSGHINEGVIAFQMNLSFIRELLASQDEPKEFVCLFDSNENLLASSRPSNKCPSAETNLWSTEKPFTLSNMPFKAKYYSTTENYLAEISDLRFTVFAIILPAFILIAFIMIHFTTRSVTKRIKRLERAARTLGTGETYHAVKSTKDDELGTLADELNRASKLIEERTRDLVNSNQELEAYSYSIAHDLRSPLRSITSFSEILKDDASSRLEPAELELLDRIIKSGQSMSQLIDDILGLARITRSDIRHVQVNLSHLAEEILSNCKNREPERNISWTIKRDMYTQGDPDLLRILLDNLLGNAWKYTRKNPRAFIRFTSKLENTRTIFSIEDNGVGFDMQYAHKLFKPFERLHTKADFEGTGIGLASVQRIIARHNGHIWIESAPEKGAIVSFTFE